jgi:hypothetical protein
MDEATLNLIWKTVGGLAALSACSWKVVEIFAPLFDKITKDDIRHMIKAVSAGVIGWLAAWGFGVVALNALGYGLHPAVDAIVAGVLCAGGADVFNVLFKILEIAYALLKAKVGMFDINSKIMTKEHLG